MVDGRVVERPRGGHRVLKLNTTGWEGRGVRTWQASTSKVVAPPVSVKDQWVDPRE
jgi:hypothetical protein